MAKKRFNLDDNFEDVAKFIEDPKDTPAPVNTAAPSVKEDAPKEPEAEKEEVSYKEPNKQFRRNITLSEEMFWCLNYIKDRKNKNRSEGDKFVAIDGLMFEMLQQALDSQYPSVKKKFENYKKEDSEDWM